MDVKKLIDEMLQVNYSPLEIRTLLIEGEEQSKYTPEELDEIKEYLDEIDPASSESKEEAAEDELSEPIGVELANPETSEEVHKELAEGLDQSRNIKSGLSCPDCGKKDGHRDGSKCSSQIGEEGSQSTYRGAYTENLSGSKSTLGIFKRGVQLKRQQIESAVTTSDSNVHDYGSMEEPTKTNNPTTGKTNSNKVKGSDLISKGILTDSSGKPLDPNILYDSSEEELKPAITASRNIKSNKDTKAVVNMEQNITSNARIPSNMFEENKNRTPVSSANNPMKVLTSLLSKVEFAKMTYIKSPDKHTIQASLYGETDSLDGVYQSIAEAKFEYAPSGEAIPDIDTICEKSGFVTFIANHKDCIKDISVKQSADIDFKRSVSSRTIRQGEKAYKLYSSHTGNYLAPFKVLTSGKNRQENLVEFIKQGKNYISPDGYVIKSSSMAKYGYPKFVLISNTIPAFFKEKTTLKASVDNMITLVSRKEEQNVILSAQKIIKESKAHESMLEKQYINKFNQLNQRIQTLEDIHGDDQQVIQNLSSRIVSSKGNDRVPSGPSEPARVPISSQLSKFCRLI